MQGIELTPEQPISNLVDLAVDAERVGFDTVFSSSHYNNRDPFIALDRIAAATETVRLGPAVANPYETHPVVLAARMATLAEVTGGRAVFGIGAGDRSTLANLGVERDRPLRRVVESIKVARSLWAGHRVDHEGTFTVRDAALNFSVDQLPPIYVGAQGPDMLRMSAKYADGVLINASHPRDVSWAADRINEGLEDRKESSGTFDVAAYASVSVAESGDAAREASRPPVAFIAGGAAPTVLERHGLDPERAAEISALIENGAFSEAFAAVSEPMLDAFCVAGTPEHVRDRFEALLEHTDSIVAGAPLGPDQPMAIELLGDVCAALPIH